jgi:F0F1-type ATP synthase assembly protein I
MVFPASVAGIFILVRGSISKWKLERQCLRGTRVLVLVCGSLPFWFWQLVGSSSFVFGGASPFFQRVALLLE